MAKNPPKYLRGTAQEQIPYGSPVLIRGGRCWPAEPSLANAVAGNRPPWDDSDGYRKGQSVFAKAIAAADQLDVHALAQLPLMDAIKINLPAGKVSEGEYQERLKLQFREAGIERNG
jgi:hypothetical protein